MAHKFKWPLAVVSALSMQRSVQEPVSLRRRWVHLQCQGRAWPGDLLPCTAAIDYGLDVRRDSRIDSGSGETCLSLCEATGLLGEAFESFIDIFLPCGAGLWRICGAFAHTRRGIDKRRMRLPSMMCLIVSEDSFGKDLILYNVTQ